MDPVLAKCLQPLHRSLSGTIEILENGLQSLRRHRFHSDQRTQDVSLAHGVEEAGSPMTLSPEQTQVGSQIVVLLVRVSAQRPRKSERAEVRVDGIYSIPENWMTRLPFLIVAALGMFGATSWAQESGPYQVLNRAKVAAKVAGTISMPTLRDGVCTFLAAALRIRESKRASASIIWTR